MDLRDAYRVLELSVGASEEAVRDARKTLAKVWHPDRHANDPELEKRAQQKLADINTAFEVIREAGFPASPDKPRPEPSPHEPPRAGEPPKPKYDPTPTPPPPAQSNIEFVPRRRVRWSVILVACAALGVGAYFAIVKLGGSSGSTSRADAGVVATVDAAPAIDAREPKTTSVIPLGGTFGLGATRDEVIAAQGQPTKEIEDTLYFRESTVTFSHRGKVVGWWDKDDVLNVKLVPTDPDVAAGAKTAGSYGIGATKDQVIGVQGTPKRIDTADKETWYFGKESSLTFNGTGKVTGYHNSNGELEIE